MREVLISIQPKWVEKICCGEKTVEVRKTRPKCETPFKVYIYCTADRRKHIADTFVPQTPLFVKNGMAKSSIGREDGLPWKLGNGKIIGEFVCDRIDEFVNLPLSLFSPIGTLEQTCLATEQVREYLNGKNGYGWHISDLVIYDKPRELCEFFQVKAIRGYHKKDEPKTEGINIPRLLNSTRFEVNFLTRPPQSWCYIETRQTED